MGKWTGVLGMAVILGLAWLFSTNRRSIKLKTILGPWAPVSAWLFRSPFQRRRFGIWFSRRGRKQAVEFLLCGLRVRFR